ncbi:SusC/RagA family TonB-linked outer membrane protein [Chitinophaga sp. SYP-B3965]|uniref:TonB-dependent receptor n=1 Tax=Chitinophaga sp. SYP-B3965 TaxID=2663120 RepID=UPI001299AA75|nr:TonB-dependent receptor [Chitinophaga sp. SYP-B3965]MRG45050.1 SusC/RagA family TonB-linked outer membrane protein [Chitinophaga sp. SYP-B3965]
MPWILQKRRVIKRRFTYLKVCCMVCILGFSGHTLMAQDLHKIIVSLDLENAGLKETVKQIESRTSIRFTYKSEDVPAFRPVTFHCTSQKLDDVLNELFKNSGLSYESAGSNVVIILKKNIAENAAATAVPALLKGRITDEKGAPVPGVSVSVKGNKTGTVTNQEGYYSLTAPESEGILVASFMGFEKKEIPFSGAGTYNITLPSEARGLNEVMVIGYGSTTRKDLTGSVGRVDIGDLRKAPVFTFTEALAGRVAGVQVSSNDGQPGQGQNIIIRGSGSLTQSTAPLYVVDGFTMEDFQSNSLNPDDIASITVLKDASSTAIYGARGSNGVVVIQTKKGLSGKPVITFNTSLGIQELRKQIPMMSPYEFVKTQTEMTDVSMADRVYFTDGKTLESYRDVEGINWQDKIFQQGKMQTYNLSMRGGNDQTKYSISGVLNNQDALVINSGYKRYLGRVSLDQQVSKHIKAGININYSNANSYGLVAANNTGTASVSNYIFANVFGYRPVAANMQALEDDLFDEDVPVGTNTVRINPVITAQNTHRVANIGELISNAYITYNIADYLTLNVRAGHRKRQTRGESFFNSLTPQGAESPVNTRKVNGSFSFAENNTWNNENTLTFEKTFAKAHKLTVLGGFSLEGARTTTYGSSAQLLPNEQLGMSGLDEGTPLALTANGGNYTLQSFFGRVDYNYRSKYLLTVTMRADGSSKFSKDNRWGYFPSAALAWNMSEENFLKQSRIISNSKLRLSYGIAGNNRIGNFDTYNRISFDNRANGVSFNNGVPGTAAWLSELGNGSLKWETTELANIGYDLGLFQNRIELTAEVYRKTTRDLLLDAQIPFTTGYATTTKNIGSIRNEGLEISLNTVNINTGSFRWESSFNISFNRSSVLELTESSTLFSGVSGGFTPALNLWLAKVGGPISAFNGFVFDGVYQYADFDNPAPGVYMLKPGVPANGNTRASIRPGDIKYRDLNGDGMVNDFDQTVIGRPEPVHIGGFSNNFSYKGLSLNVFFQWSSGNDIFNGNRLVFEGNSQYSYHTNQFATWADRWSPENPTNKNFRVGGQGPTGRGSSRVVEDGSYLRLKTLSLAYQIPAKLLSRAYVRNLSISASAQNLITWTKYSGMDPEVSVKNSALTRGFDYSAYPQAQTMVIGINASF